MHEKAEIITTAMMALNHPVVPPSTTTTTNSSSPLRIPDFLFVGAPKTGTTAITDYLQRVHHHPHICLAEKHNGTGGGYSDKEPHFFDHYDRYTQGLAYYANLYRNCPPPPPSSQNSYDYDDYYYHNYSYALDATPASFAYAQEIYEIYRQHGTAGTVKIFMILREPMAREFSWYQHMASDNSHKDNSGLRPRQAVRHFARKLQRPILDHDHHPNATMSSSLSSSSPLTPTPTHRLMTFEEYWNETLRGQLQRGSKNKRNTSLYVLWLRQWFTLFNPTTQIWIGSYDELRHNQTAFVMKLNQFLGLPQPPSSQLSSQQQQEPPHKSTTTNPSTSTNEKEKEDDRGIRIVNQKGLPHGIDVPSCAVQEAIFHWFEPYNQKLYQLLHQQQPFHSSSSLGNKNHHYHDNKGSKTEPGGGSQQQSWSSLSISSSSLFAFPQFQFHCITHAGTL